LALIICLLIDRSNISRAVHHVDVNTALRLVRTPRQR
jgi:hypothetical protein